MTDAEYQNKRRFEIRQKLKRYKSHCKCEVCGENSPPTLDFHHKDPSKKDFSISSAVANKYSWKKILQELSKTRCLCANCHRKLHYELENNKANERRKQRYPDRRQTQREAWQTQRF